MSDKVQPIDGQYRTANPEMRIVRFYPTGLTTDKELTAIVLAEDRMNRGSLDLLVCRGGTALRPYKSVRHAEDPFFDYMPKARNNGVWDYLEIDRPAKKQVKKEAPKS